MLPSDTSCAQQASPTKTQTVKKYGYAPCHVHPSYHIRSHSAGTLSRTSNSIQYSTACAVPARATLNSVTVFPASGLRPLNQATSNNKQHSPSMKRTHFAASIDRKAYAPIDCCLMPSHRLRRCTYVVKSISSRTSGLERLSYSNPSSTNCGKDTNS